MSVHVVVYDRSWVGCVVSEETGVLEVLTDEGLVRASLDGAMLGRVARDRSQLPGPGDWVRLRRWPDRQVTVEATCLPEGARSEVLADVLPLRRTPPADPG